MPSPIIDRQRVFERTWSARSAGMWGIAAFGLITGLAVGLISPFFPVLVGAQTFLGAAALLPKSLAIFSALGMTTGFGIGVMIGANAGASAGAMEEGIKYLGRDSDGKTVGKSVSDASPPMSLKDTYRTYINPRVGLVMTAAGMLGGAIIAAGYFALGGPASWAMPAMETLLGPALSGNAAAVTSYFVGTMGAFGALWTFNYPKIAGHFQKAAGDLIGGKWFGREWGPETSTEQTLKPSNPQIQSASEVALDKDDNYFRKTVIENRLISFEGPERLH